MAYRVLRTAAFIERFERFPRDIRGAFEKKIGRLAEDPFAVGKPLRYPYVRELRVKGFRVYYFISHRRVIVLLCDASDKKEQQETIDRIISEKDSLIRLMEKL